MTLGNWFRTLALVVAAMWLLPASARSVTGNASDVGNCGGLDPFSCVPCEGTTVSGASFCHDFTYLVQDSLTSIRRLDQGARDSGWERSGGNPYTSVMGPSTTINGPSFDESLDPRSFYDPNADDSQFWSDDGLFDAEVSPRDGGQITFKRHLEGAFILTLTGGSGAEAWTGTYFFGRSSRFDAGDVLNVSGDMRAFDSLARVSIFALDPARTVPEPPVVALVLLGAAMSMVRRRR